MLHVAQWEQNNPRSFQQLKKPSVSEGFFYDQELFIHRVKKCIRRTSEIFSHRRLLRSTFVGSMQTLMTATDKREKLDDELLEAVSGGMGLVLPDYLNAMSKDELRGILKDPDFVGSPEWQELIELNPKGSHPRRQSKRRDN